MNDAKKTFKELVKTCLIEVRKEREGKQQLRETLKKYVRGVLKEVITGPVSPEPQDKEEKEKIDKGFDKAGNQPKEESQDQQVQQIASIVTSINKNFNVHRETEGVTGAYSSGKRSFIIIDGGELVSIRIKERWENNFDIEEIIRESDRVIAVGLSWPQVKAFVKANVSEISKTTPNLAKDKAMAHLDDKTPKRDKDLPDTSIPNRGEKKNGEDAKLGTTKKDDMDYKKDDVEKDEDQPSAPLKAVTKPGEDPKSMNKPKDQKETPQVKPPKHKNDDELVKRMPGKKKDKGDEK
jgi:hypothetical protein